MLNITAGVLLLGACLLVISLWATNRSVEQLSGSLTKRVIATTDARLQGFFEPVQVALEISAQRVSGGEFEAFPLESMDQYFAPMVERISQLSALSYAHDDGDEYLLLWEGNTWESRHTRPTVWGKQAEWRQWEVDSTEKPIERRDIEYDARTRPWFTGAIARLEEVGESVAWRERIHWTAPYRFFTTGQPGLSASLAHRSNSGRTIVLAFDILLSDISRFTSNLEIGERGKAFVLRGKPEVPSGLVVVGLPADDRFKNEEVLVDFILSPPDDLGGPVASFVAQFNEARIGNVVPFMHEGERWWGALERSKLETTASIWVGSVVPEAELLEGLPNTNLIVIAITGLILALALRRSFSVAKRYAMPLEELTDRGNRMQRLNFEPVEPVQSHITEIRDLSTTLEGMRGALQTYSAAREDVRVAKTIRAMTLPPVLSWADQLEIRGWHEAGAEVGGETYDIFELPDSGGALIAHFDCPGTGVSAAIYGNQLRSALRTAAANDAEPRAVAGAIERFLETDLPDCVPVRAWIVRLLGDPPVLETIGLGMDALVLKRGAQVEQLASEGHSLGLPGQPPLPDTRSLTLAGGDVLVLASDGVIDALNAERGRFGLGGIEQVLVESANESPDEIITRITSALADCAATPSGDRTLVVVRVPR